MRMRSGDGCARAELVLDRRHEGAPGFAHGGIVAAALDDLFGGVLVILETPAVTARLTVDYRAPVLLGRTLTLTGWCESTDGRKLHLVGTIHDADTLVAEAQALFMEVDVAHFAKSGLPLPAEWQRWGKPAPGSPLGQT
jgi:acyl-coenzyme A thioesterase PaaI-like protein